MGWRSLRSLTAAVAARPSLWPEAVRAWLDFRSPGSIVPSRDVLRWRIATAYGHDGASILPSDAVRFLEWRRSLRLMRKVTV